MSQKNYRKFKVLVSLSVFIFAHQSVRAYEFCDINRAIPGIENCENAANERSNTSAAICAAHAVEIKKNTQYAYTCKYYSSQALHSSGIYGGRCEVETSGLNQYEECEYLPVNACRLVRHCIVRSTNPNE